VAEFKNPNQASAGSGGTQDNKSLILMMIVMVGVFFGLQYYRQKTNPPLANPATQNGGQSAGQAAAQRTVETPSAVAAPVGQVQAALGTQAIQAVAETTTVLENELYKIVFSNRGGQVVSWILKKQKDADGKPLNLVHEQAAKAFGYPLSLFTYDSATTAAVNSAMYVASATGSI
jgi:YidC/Oxa1 family membrane protein insertase